MCPPAMPSTSGVCTAKNLPARRGKKTRVAFFLFGRGDRRVRQRPRRLWPTVMSSQSQLLQSQSTCWSTGCLSLRRTTSGTMVEDTCVPTRRLSPTVRFRRPGEPATGWTVRVRWKGSPWLRHVKKNKQTPAEKHPTHLPAPDDKQVTSCDTLGSKASTGDL